MISIDDFKKVEIRIGLILTAEAIPNSEKLLKLSVDFGEESPREVISGIAKFFPDSSILVGKKCAFVTNLEPRPIMGHVSQAMILATTGDDFLSLFEVPSSVPQGSLVR